MEQIQLFIEGMTCGHCTMTVRKALIETPGVKSAEVSLEEKSAVVIYKPNKVTAQDLISSVENVGYKAKIT
ncbi:MAG: heavy-metal-associated domain-containing protein [Candidatus Heimdallarchaeaceae archaeon]